MHSTWDLIAAGGWLMAPIILGSIIALTIIFERFMSLRRTRVLPPDLVMRILPEARSGQMTASRLGVLAAGSPLGRVLAAGLGAPLSREEMKERIEDAGRHVAHELERYLNTLGTIAVISPLLGLLGTVVGIIDVFAAMSLEQGDALQTTALAGGISKALVTTAAGICVAVPALIFYRYFRGLVDALVIDMERETIRLVETLHPGVMEYVTPILGESLHHGAMQGEESRKATPEEEPAS
ncbi:MAG: MotA/TolQ/ExbB proton channel family protein [Pseudomonadota bacterium]